MKKSYSIPTSNFKKMLLTMRSLNQIKLDVLKLPKKMIGFKAPLRMINRVLFISRHTSPESKKDICNKASQYPDIVKHIHRMLRLITSKKIHVMFRRVKDGNYIIEIRSLDTEFQFLVNLFPTERVPIAHDLHPLADIFALDAYGYYPISGKVVDVGGYIGDTAVYFAKEGASEVFVYEPNPYNFFYLRENIRLNNVCNKVKPFKLGVCRDDGVNFFKIPINMSGGGSLYEIPYHKKEDLISIKVKTINCKNILNSVRHINLLKLDCKGCEVDVIEACGQELQDYVDYMIFQAETIDNKTLNRVLNTLKSLSFRIDKVDKTYSLIYGSRHK